MYFADFDPKQVLWDAIRGGIVIGLVLGTICIGVAEAIWWVFYHVQVIVQ